MKRIICTGNLFQSDAGARARVYESLSQVACPPEVKVIDGGVAGLDLLPSIEPAQRVVFADVVMESGSSSQFAVQTLEEFKIGMSEIDGHSSDLGYLLRALPLVMDGPLPEIFIVSIEAGADDDAVREAAAMCLALVMEGERAAQAVTAPAGRSSR